MDKKIIKIGIDLSLSSTAIYLVKDDKEYLLCYLNGKKPEKWAKKLENDIENIKINRIKYDDYSTLYSDSEIQKLNKYDEISDLMIDDIKNIVGVRECIINIEGYSYASKSSSINDIIALSTLVRIKLLKNIDCEINILSPMSLKLETSKYTYGISEIKKYNKKTNKQLKSEFKSINHDGIAGGKFTKFEMYNALVDKGVDNIILKFLKDNVEMLQMKKIPSPIDDIVDSICLVSILK